MARPSKFPTWATGGNYPAGPNPWNGTPERVDPGSGKQTEGFDPKERVPAQVLNWIIGTEGDWLQYLDSLIGADYFGDGSETGGTNPDVTTKDHNYDDVTITSTQHPTVALYIAGTLTINCANALVYDGGAGGNAVAANHGIAGTAGNSALGAAAAGGKGADDGTPAAADPGGGTSVTLSGNGGVGGQSATGASWGAGGTATHGVAATASLKTPLVMTRGLLASPSGIDVLTGGPGGGGGGRGGTGSSGGGGGGGGAGCGFIAARRIVINTSVAGSTHISAQGGAGGLGAGSGGNGGGGSGGTLIILYQEIVDQNGNPATLHAAVNGGIATPNTNGHTDPSDGSGGELLLIQVPFNRSTGGPAFSAPPQPHIESGVIYPDGTTDTFTATFAIQFNAPSTGVGSYSVTRLVVYSSDGTPIDAVVTNKAASLVSGGPKSMTIVCQTIPANGSEIYWECRQ